MPINESKFFRFFIHFTNLFTLLKNINDEYLHVYIDHYILISITFFV